MLVAGIVIGTVFAFLSPQFLTAASAGSILASAVQFGMVGLGVTILMISGEFDLSVASVYSLCPLVMASLWIDHGFNVFMALGFALTLRSASACSTGSRRSSSASRRSSSRSPPRCSGRGQPQPHRRLSDLVLRRFAGDELARHRRDRQQQDLRLDPLADRHRHDPRRRAPDGRGQLDLRERRRRPRGARDGRAGRAGQGRLLLLSSLLAAFTGIIQFGSFGSATPTQGSDLALTAIVVAVVGGGSLMGGRGSIMGALLAAIVLGMSYTGLILSGVSTTWFQSFVGFLLLFAVIINQRTAGLGARFGVIRKS